MGCIHPGWIYESNDVLLAPENTFLIKNKKQNWTLVWFVGVVY